MNPIRSLLIFVALQLANVLGLVPSVSARPDPVNEVLIHLEQEKPIVVRMECDLGTLRKDREYILRYSPTSFAFDLNGWNGHYNKYTLARYSNASLAAGEVSLWGIKLRLRSDIDAVALITTNGHRVARVGDLASTYRLIELNDAVHQTIDHVLKNSAVAYDPNKYVFSYAGNKYSTCGNVWVTNPKKPTEKIRTGPLHMLTRHVADDLRRLALTQPLIYRQYDWEQCTLAMKNLFWFLHNRIDLVEKFGIKSDYECYHDDCHEKQKGCGVDKYNNSEYMTAAIWLRGVHTYYLATGHSTAHEDFRAVSAEFMRDYDTSDSGMPNGMGQVLWVAARWYHDKPISASLPTLDQIVERCGIALLEDQFLYKSMEDCGIARGFGGWTHDNPENIFCKYNCEYKLANLTSHCTNQFADDYKQLSKYHNMCVFGLSDFLHMIQIQGLVSRNQDYQLFAENAPYGLMAALSWLMQVSRPCSEAYTSAPKFMSCEPNEWVIWNKISSPFDEKRELLNAKNEEAPSRDRGPENLATYYEIMRTIPAMDMMPFPADYPTSSTPWFEPNDLVQRLQGARLFYKGWPVFRSILTPEILYGPLRVQYAYPSLRPDVF